MIDTKERPRPICAKCTRNARVADMPRVIVRVEAATVVRPHPISAPSLFHILCRCHGEQERIEIEWNLPPYAQERDVENLTAFSEKAK